MKLTIIKYAFSGMLATILSLSVGNAQVVLLKDMNGRPYKNEHYENVNGSPFLKDEFQRGKVVLVNGTVYEDMPLKYDLVAGQLLFQSESGQTLAFSQPVHEFQFQGEANSYRNGFAPVDKNTAASFYQVLEDGKVKLLKKSDKVIQEQKGYGTATVTKNIMEYTNYYIEADKLIRVKNEKDILQALPKHEAALKEYIKKNNLKPKKEEDMVQLIKYYNTI